MADTTDIEKKSLEAHVELCAERYRLLETKLESMEMQRPFIPMWDKQLTSYSTNVA